jgi:hypothetical protein
VNDKDLFNGKDPLAITDPMEWAEAFERLVKGSPDLEIDAGLMVGWFSMHQSALESEGFEAGVQAERERAAGESEAMARAMAVADNDFCFTLLDDGLEQLHLRTRANRYRALAFAALSALAVVTGKGASDER